MRIDTDFLKKSNLKTEVFQVPDSRMNLLYSHIEDLMDGKRTYGELLIDALDICDNVNEQLLCVAIIERFSTSVKEGLDGLDIKADQPNPLMALPIEEDAATRLLASISKTQRSDTDVLIELRDQSRSLQEFVVGVIMLMQPKTQMG